MLTIKKVLKQGKVIIYPTDTAYAIGGDLLNKKTRDRVYKIKRRDKIKALSSIANSLSMVKKYCLLNKQEKALAKKYWPGPLTLVLRVKLKYQKLLGLTLAIRVPDNQIARKLSRELNKPLISTSANLSGKAACYNVKNVLKQLQATEEKIDVVIDAGELKKQAVSTIVKVQDGQIQIIREGAIKKSKFKNQKLK